MSIFNSDTAPIKVAVSGAAGQIGYALLFRIASGQLLGRERSVSLNLLELPQALGALDGVEMELADCAFSTLASVHKTAKLEEAFADADVIFLVGARPRGAGMERKDLLSANAEIFSAQGRAINAVAKKSVRVIVVGNPANTNCLIARHNAPDLPDSAFSAMTRLDHNRAIAQISQQSGAAVAAIKKMIIWGNHSSTQYPDIHHTTINGAAVLDSIDFSWVEKNMIPDVQQRGAAIIKARGASSAASAASAALDHMHDWICDSAADDFVSMGIVSGGQYDIEAGLVYSYPVICSGGKVQVVEGLACNDFSVEKMRATEKELMDERDAVRHLLS